MVFVLQEARKKWDVIVMNKGKNKDRLQHSHFPNTKIMHSAPLHNILTTISNNNKTLCVFPRKMLILDTKSPNPNTPSPYFSSTTLLILQQDKKTLISSTYTKRPPNKSLPNEFKTQLELQTSKGTLQGIGVLTREPNYLPSQVYLT